MPSTILIVDDSRTVLTMVRQALEADHHQVIEAMECACSIRSSARAA